MRCNICDAPLSPEEIKIDPRYGTFDPCGKCLTVIGEIFSDEDEVEETVLGDADEEFLLTDVENMV